jgi:kumamolisin
MKFMVKFAATLLSPLLITCWCAAAFGQGNIHIPDSTIERLEDLGSRAHTNHLIVLNRIGPDNGSGPGGTMTPADLRRFYNLPSTGGAGIVAIVDAYHYPDAVADFNYFSTHYGNNLPTENGNGNVLQVVYEGGSQPAYNSGWSQEAALDIEWAHAMAPNAKIILVEAQDNSFTHLFAAVDLATSLGARQVSMSWSSSEFSSETSFDSHFQATTAVYLSSSGDSGGRIQYPSSSPWVVAVGGTSCATDTSHNLTSETGWSGSGGGTSAYEPKPFYQNNVPGTPSGARGCPDISSDADPNTGVIVRWQGGDYQFGGTSVSSPCVAGMLNLSGASRGGSQGELSHLYSNRSYGVNLNDITKGRAGRFHCSSGWDFVTGLGSPWGLADF